MLLKLTTFLLTLLYCSVAPVEAAGNEDCQNIEQICPGCFGYVLWCHEVTHKGGTGYKKKLVSVDRAKGYCLDPDFPNDGCATGHFPVFSCKNVKPISVTFYSFIPGELEVLHSPESVFEAIDSLNGNFDATFGRQENVVSLQERVVLRNFTEQAFENALLDDTMSPTVSNKLHEEFRLHVSASKLAELISVESIRRMYDAFQAYEAVPIASIILRRNYMEGNTHIEYHHDGSMAVMHVWLNDDGLEGGNLIYLNGDGSTTVDTEPGSAVFHGRDLVHGVNSFNGTRYILIFGGQKNWQQDIFADILNLDSSEDANADSSINAEL